MIERDFILCLRETAFRFIPKQPSECLLNLPCKCAYPGRESKCEECPHLEACLSHMKLHTAEGRNIKIGR